MTDAAFTDSRDDARIYQNDVKKRNGFRKIAILALLVPLLGFGLWKGYCYWSASQHFETTDDAFLDGHVSQVAPQVAGRVIALSVYDNEKVAAGQTLVTIDPRDYKIRLSQAKAQGANTVAQLKQVEAQLDLQKANIDQAAANLRATEADAVQANQDQVRYNSILPKAVTQQEIDRANASAKSSMAKVEASKQALVAAKAQLLVTKAQVEAAHASMDQSQAQIANANLQLSYATIQAPVAGRVTKRFVEIGNYVSPGQALLSIVPDEVWVTANYKETQLSDMHIGQPVELRIDAFPKDLFKGHVDSFQTGTGSAFSSLPAENATGNYVKVVQRIPVKIVFEAGQKDLDRLAPGMSVEPKVEVR